MNDSEFDDLLRTARGADPLPASFRQGVWHRIESAAVDTPHGAAWLRAAASVLLRPWGAVASVTATVALGLWFGVASIPDRQETKVAYAESISPFAHPHRK